MLRSKPKHSPPQPHHHRRRGRVGVTASKNKKAHHHHHHHHATTHHMSSASFTAKATTKTKATPSSSSPSPTVEDLLRSQLAEANAKIASLAETNAKIASLAESSAEAAEANAKLAEATAETNAKIAAQQQQIAAQQQQIAVANAKIAELSLLKNVPLLPLVVDDVPYDPTDEAALRTFWSTNCNARNTKLKHHISTKQPLPLADFVAILKNNTGDVIEREHDLHSRNGASHIKLITQYVPFALTLTNTPTTAPPSIDLMNHVRVEIENAIRENEYDGASYSAHVFGRVVINGEMITENQILNYWEYDKNDWSAELPTKKITAFLSTLFSPKRKQHKQRIASLSLIDLSTINAENIDTIDLTKINLYDLVPKDKRGAYIFETTRTTYIPNLYVYWAADCQNLTMEELFAGMIMLKRHRQAISSSFDFDTFAVPDTDYDDEEDEDNDDEEDEAEDDEEDEAEDDEDELHTHE